MIVGLYNTVRAHVSVSSHEEELVDEYKLGIGSLGGKERGRGWRCGKAVS